MAALQLPERPSLEQLKRQAKDLLHSARAGELGALGRFRILPAFARRSDADLGRAAIALHDAQSVIAREYGLDSWNALRERVEELAFGFETAVDQFVEAATGGRRDRAERLLTLHPGIANATFYTALLLGDAAAVDARLAAAPALATAPGGPRGWEPLHYVCYSAVGRGTSSREAGLVAVARRLIALGADANLRFPWLHHGVRRPVLWGAVCAVRSLPLAKALLEAGADPSDGVTLPLAAGDGDVAALALLHAHGANVDRPWATDGAAPLYAILHWAKTADGPRWLLEHGATPDPVFAATGETPLHVVAASWGTELAEQLVSRGADVDRRRADGRTPYAVAELNGNRAVAEWLEAHGAASDTSDVDRLVAMCSRGDGAGASAMLERHPGLRAEIRAEHYGALYRAAERNDTAALETMMACGFDPNRGDESIGKTALHVAAMEGWPDAVRVLLSHGASVSVRDREFRAQPLIWAAEGSRTSREGRDHAAAGRLLLDAGSPTEWETGAEPSEAILEIVNAWRGVETE
ncbi:MAG TPA: ankyrin repeat domain-containing protein [Vicinamibacterales bacterium]|jgi:ankyrin repeat protein|nr:ankyrin repeat domain-containing protein [Vicinamibacterales bacterium]